MGLHVRSCECLFLVGPLPRYDGRAPNSYKVTTPPYRAARGLMCGQMPTHAVSGKEDIDTVMVGGLLAGPAPTACKASVEDRCDSCHCGV
jgi:hypothetical protein